MDGNKSVNDVDICMSRRICSLSTSKQPASNTGILTFSWVSITVISVRELVDLISCGKIAGDPTCLGLTASGFHAVDEVTDVFLMIERTWIALKTA